MGAGDQTFGPPSSPFSAALAGSWIRKGAAETWICASIWDVNVAGSILTHCATRLASETYFNDKGLRWSFSLEYNTVANPREGPSGTSLCDETEPSEHCIQFRRHHILPGQEEPDRSLSKELPVAQAFGTFLTVSGFAIARADVHCLRPNLSLHLCWRWIWCTRLTAAPFLLDPIH